MTGTKAIVVAGLGMCLALAGCNNSELLSGLFVSNSGPNGDHVVYGSLETVAQSTQSSLTQLGLVVSRTDEKGVVRLTSTTRTGSRFTLVLTSDQNYQGERVRLRIDWHDARDDQAGVQILAHVEKQASH